MSLFDMFALLLVVFIQLYLCIDALAKNV